MKLVIATNNKNKLQEIKEIIGNFFEVAYSLNELNIDIDIVEDGIAYFDNALIKAKTISKLTNMVALADDSGLSVDALCGEPGVYSARYSGDHNDAKNIEFLLKNMENITDRTAHFVSSIVLYFPNGTYLATEGYTDGRILREVVGDKGFGYDPIFFSNDLNKSFGEASSEEKNAVSHRGRALRELQSKLLNYNL